MLRTDSDQGYFLLFLLPVSFLPAPWLPDSFCALLPADTDFFASVPVFTGSFFPVFLEAVFLAFTAGAGSRYVIESHCSH